LRLPEPIRANPGERCGSELRVASVADPQSIDAAIRGSRAVINCAGPFLDTAIPIIEAALHLGIHFSTSLQSRRRC
jgi:short subunit dehydrogenase-like uncharacterized protein